MLLGPCAAYRVPLTRSARPRSPLTSRSRAAPCPAVPPPLPCGAHAAAARRCVRGRPRRAQPTPPLPEHPRASAPVPPRPVPLPPNPAVPAEGRTARPGERLRLPVRYPHGIPGTHRTASAPGARPLPVGAVPGGHPPGAGTAAGTSAAPRPPPLLKGPTAPRHRHRHGGARLRAGSEPHRPRDVCPACAPRAPTPCPVPRIPIQPPPALRCAWYGEAVSSTAPPGGGVGVVTHSRLSKLRSPASPPPRALRIPLTALLSAHAPSYVTDLRACALRRSAARLRRTAAVCPAHAQSLPCRPCRPPPGRARPERVPAAPPP